MAPIGCLSAVGAKDPLGYGHEWGGSKLDQQRTPQGLMLLGVAPTGGIHSSAPLPLLGARGPSPPTPPPDSSQAQIPKARKEGWGHLHHPPAISLLIFQEVPNHYWLSQKINSL